MTIANLTEDKELSVIRTEISKAVATANKMEILTVEVPALLTF
jgi:hypothetical protein